MTRPFSLFRSLLSLDVIRSPKKRRILFLVLLLITSIFIVFPEKYRASVTMAPTDPGSLGLGAALGQLNATNTAFGSQAAVEVAMKVGRSVTVRNDVIKDLDLTHVLDRDSIHTSRWLDDHVTIRTLRGGIIEIEMIEQDYELSKKIIGAYRIETQKELGIVAKRQTAYKRQILNQLVEESNTRFQRAQSAYDNFRLNTRYADPSSAMGAIGSRAPTLKAAIKAKEVELSSARQFATDQNISVRQITAQIDALKRQLTEFEALNVSGSNSIRNVVNRSTEAQKLERELIFSKTLYYNYVKYLEGASLEDLTAIATIRVLEPPYIDTARQWNQYPLYTFIALFLLLISVEFYYLRPPLGDI
jgi:hypothetical protein